MKAFSLTVAFLSLAISSLSAFAGQAIAWELEESKQLVTLSIDGKVTKGDRHRFILFKKNCNNDQPIFSFYTTQPNDFSGLKGRVIGIDYNGAKIGGKIITSKKAMRGNVVMISLGSYEIDNLV